MGRSYYKIIMIIFLYGADGYRIKENVDTIVNAHRKKYQSGMSYYRFDLGESKNFDELSNAVKSVSFFDEAKLIVVKNLFTAGVDLLDKLSGLVTNLRLTSDKKTVLVFVENIKKAELQKTNKELFSSLNTEPNLVREINYLEGVKLSNWVRSKFKDNGHTVSPAVAGLLVDMIGSESWALVNEVNKLSNYKSWRGTRAQPGLHRSGTITEKDVNLFVSQKEDNSIFDLIDAVGNKNKAKAFEMMYRLVNSGQDGHYLLSMLVYHFENLLSVSDLFSRSQASGGGSLASKCGLHPFVAKKAMSQAGKFRKEDLLSKFNHLAGLDIASKNGTIDLEDSLYNFVFF